MPVLHPPETVPQLARRLNAPAWLVRKLADQITREQGGCPRIGFMVRLISAEVAGKIEEALSCRRSQAGEVACG